MDIQEFRLDSLPSTCFYIPNFLTEAEEKLLLHNIEVKTPKSRWTQLRNRRLINVGGVPTQKGMIPEEISPYLQAYIDKVNDLTLFGEAKANHILLNEYLPGQGIMSHFDGPLFYPTISTISIGSHTVLEFYEPKSEDTENFSPTDPVMKLLVEPRSLLVLRDDLYTRYMHSISDLHEDDIGSDPLIKNIEKCSISNGSLKRSTRYSLTIRHVPKTIKLKLKFGK